MAMSNPVVRPPCPEPVRGIGQRRMDDPFDLFKSKRDLFFGSLRQPICQCRVTTATGGFSLDQFLIRFSSKVISYWLFVRHAGYLFLLVLLEKGVNEIVSLFL